MQKILLIQRKLQHYRKLLLKSIEDQKEYTVDVLNMGDKESHEDKIHTFPSKTFFRYKNYNIQRSNALINYLKEHYAEYDFIIMEGASNITNNLPIARFLRSHNKPYVVWDAGRRKNSKMSLPRKLAQNNLEYVWKNAAGIIAYSTLAKEYFMNIGIPSEKIFVCHNTLNVGEFDKQINQVSDETIKEIRNKYVPQNGNMILYVGAVETRKRIKDLIDAADIVHKKNALTSLVIIGDGNAFQELKEYAEGRDYVFLLGSIIDGVIPYFMSCDVFALPSEGGLSLNQAMICSKPVIASSADGTELDLIEDGKNGFLFQETDVNDLAEKIQSVLDNRERRIEMGRYSREVIDSRINNKEFYKSFKKCLDSIQ